MHNEVVLSRRTGCYVCSKASRREELCIGVHSLVVERLDRPVLTRQELSERNGGLGLFSANDMSDMDVGRS